MTRLNPLQSLTSLLLLWWKTLESDRFSISVGSWWIIRIPSIILAIPVVTVLHNFQGTTDFNDRLVFILKSKSSNQRALFWWHTFCSSRWISSTYLELYFSCTPSSISFARIIITFFCILFYICVCFLVFGLSANFTYGAPFAAWDISTKPQYLISFPWYLVSVPWSILLFTVHNLSDGLSHGFIHLDKADIISLCH